MLKSYWKVMRIMEKMKVNISLTDLEPVKRLIKANYEFINSESSSVEMEEHKLKISNILSEMGMI